MNVVLVVALLSVALVASGCVTRASDSMATNPPMAHTSRNSLDWAGTYQGTLPCADCPGIQTRVELAQDETFVLSMQYIDKDASPRTSRGTFKWDTAGRTIELQGPTGSSWHFQVIEGGLAALDRQGQPIKGGLASSYVLAQVGSGPAGPSTPDASLAGSPSWRLVELFGAAVTPADTVEQVPNIHFDPKTQRVYGYTGCNQFTGSYSVEPGNRLLLSQLASTRRACIGPDLEPQFLRALNSVDRFEVRDRGLSLMQADGTVSARFRAAELPPASGH